MEEEIIETEEVPNYDKLRYILDKNDYVCHASIGALIVCDLGECIEYKGEIPEGFSTIEEWYDMELERLNAWKIIDGNLVFDENKYNELQAIWAIEAEENELATHKFVRNQLGKESQIIIDEFSNQAEGNSLVILENSGDYDIPNITLSSEDVTGLVNVVSSNKNLLGIDAVNTTIHGISITINEDGSITLDGTSTNTIEFDLKGTSTNLDMLFLIKEELNYVVSGLTENVSLSLYNFDGTDKTLIGNYTNGNINLSTSEIVTQATLKIPSGKAFEQITIYPQIEINEEATEFIKHKENKASIDLTDNNVLDNELDSYSPTTILMSDKDVNLIVDYFKYKSISNKIAEIEINEETITTQVSDLADDLNGLDEKIDLVQTTILEQTNESFTMWFEETGLKNDLNTVQEALKGNTDDINTITEYIHFEGAEITLGKSDSQTKLVIRNDKISFMNGDNESAYISENTLYITDSTVLNKMQVGRWETKEDDLGNLNTKWVGGE